MRQVDANKSRSVYTQSISTIFTAPIIKWMYVPIENGQHESKSTMYVCLVSLHEICICRLYQEYCYMKRCTFVTSSSCLVRQSKCEYFLLNH